MLKKIVMLALLCLGLAQAETILCEGTYKWHLQGIDSDGKAIFWVFTDQLVKTDMTGKILQKTKVTRHGGDPCLHDGKVYVPVNQGKFNEQEGSKDSVEIYDANTLEKIAQYPVENYKHGLGAIEWHGGKLWLTGGLPKGAPGNVILEYTEDMKFVKRHDSAGYTNMGIQTLNYAFGHWWYGVYDKPANILCDDAFKVVARPAGPGLSVGMAVLEDGTVLIAYTAKKPDPENPKINYWTGSVKTAAFDKEAMKLVLK